MLVRQLHRHPRHGRQLARGRVRHGARHHARDVRRLRRPRRDQTGRRQLLRLPGDFGEVLRRRGQHLLRRVRRVHVVVVLLVRQRARIGARVHEPEPLPEVLLRVREV
eukprot:29242-Pelagococcus_subviridis.AAC.6